MEEIKLANLLRELTDEEVKTSLARGGKGAYCDLYKSLLPIAIAGCMAGNSSSCGEMKYYTEYLHKYC